MTPWKPHASSIAPSRQQSGPAVALLAVAIGVVLVIAGKPTVRTRQRLPPRTGGWRLRGGYYNRKHHDYTHYSY